MREDDFPATLVEFQERFGTEEACRAYLFQIRWPAGYRCPVCGHSKGWTNRRNDVQCAQCGRQTSLTAGTILEGTRKPLRQWFLAIWWVSTQKTGGSAKGLQRLLGFKSYQTAWTWLHKLRRAMVRAGRERLSGVVEVDDTLLGGVEPGGVGRKSATKARLAVAVEVTGKKIGRIRLSQVQDFTAEALIPFVEETVEPGSQVITDGWRSYQQLRTKGYRHRRKVVGADHARATRLLPNVHRVIALLKRWLIGTHHGRVEHRHLQSYLDEFTFRFNRRKSKFVGKIFFRLLQQGALTKPLAYRTLVASSHRRNHNPLGLHD